MLHRSRGLERESSRSGIIIPHGGLWPRGCVRSTGQVRSFWFPGPAGSEFIDSELQKSRDALWSCVQEPGMHWLPLVRLAWTCVTKALHVFTQKNHILVPKLYLSGIVCLYWDVWAINYRVVINRVHQEEKQECPEKPCAAEMALHPSTSTKWMWCRQHSNEKLLHLRKKLRSLHTLHYILFSLVNWFFDRCIVHWEALLNFVSAICWMLRLITKQRSTCVTLKCQHSLLASSTHPDISIVNKLKIQCLLS